MSPNSKKRLKLDSCYIILAHPSFNYSAEIFLTEVRSRDTAIGIMGWAIGLGAGTLYNPVTFNSICGYGLFIYGEFNRG